MTASLTDVAALRAELTSRGIELQVDGARLLYRPPSRMTAALLDRLRHHKESLVRTLSTPADADTNTEFGQQLANCVDTDPPNPSAPGAPAIDRRARRLGSKVLFFWIKTMMRAVSPYEARALAASFFDRWVSGDGERELPDVESWPTQFRAVLDTMTRALGTEEWCRRSAEDAIRRFVRSHDPTTVGSGRWTLDKDRLPALWVRRATTPARSPQFPATRATGPTTCPCCTPEEPVGRAWWSRPRPAETFGVFTEEDLNTIARNLKADDRVVARRLGPDRLPADPNEWPEPWRAELDRRVECMVREGSLTRDEAVRKVEPFIRRWTREVAAGIDADHRLLADQVGSCGAPDEPQRPFTPDALDPVTPTNSSTETKGANSDVAVS